MSRVASRPRVPGETRIPFRREQLGSTFNVRLGSAFQRIDLSARRNFISSELFHANSRDWGSRRQRWIKESVRGACERILEAEVQFLHGDRKRSEKFGDDNGNEDEIEEEEAEALP